jgi:tetratricopeptide (TPR) repeat protein
LIVLLGVPSIVYASCLGHGFVWDDHGLIQIDPWIQDLRHLAFLLSPEYWTHYFVGIKGQYRPVRAVTLALQWAIWGDNPLPFHAFNLLVHLANVWLVRLILLRLSGRGEVAWVGAMLFALHPMHTEVVVWVKNRSELLSLCFSLLALLAYLEALDAGTTRRSLLLQVGSALSYLLALLSKEMAITVPLFIVAHGVLLHRGSKRRSLLLALPALILTLLYLSFKLAFLTPHGQQGPPPLPLDIHVLLILRTLGAYLWMLLVPVHLNADRTLPLDGLATQWQTWASAASLLLVLVLGLVLLLRRSRIALYGLLWIIVGLIPVSNVLYQHTRPIADQRLYLPSVGFSLLVGLAFSRLRLRFPVARFRETGPLAVLVAGEVLIGLYAVRTYVRIEDWRDDMSLIQHTLRHSPDSPRPHLQMGLLLSHQGDLDGAAREFHRVLELSPYNVDAHKNLGVVLTEKRDFARAARYFANALRLAPDSVELLYNISIPLTELGKHEEAQKALERALQISPGNPQILTHWGILQGKMGRFKEALSAFDQALESQPRNLKARIHRAYAYGELGDLARAVEELKTVLSLSPWHIPTYLDLANTYHRKGELEMAQKVLEDVLSWSPEDGRVHNALGNILVARGRHQESIERFRRAAELSPNQALPYYNLGRACLEAGRPDEALDPLRKAVEIEPRNPKIRRALSMALRQLEMDEEAKEEEQRAEVLEKGEKTLLSPGAVP